MDIKKGGVDRIDSKTSLIITINISDVSKDSTVHSFTFFDKCGPMWLLS